MLLMIGDDWAKDHHDIEIEDGRRLHRARLLTVADGAVVGVVEIADGKLGVGGHGDGLVVTVPEVERRWSAG